MDKNMLMELQKSNFQNTVWKGLNMLRLKEEQSDIDCFVALAAMAYVTRKNDFAQQESLQSFVDKNIQDFTTRGFLLTFIGEYWKEILAYSTSNGKELLASALFFSRTDRRRVAGVGTPSGVNALALQLLNVQEGETLTDFCSGTGSFLVDAYLHTGAAKLSGVEISTQAIIAATIRSWLLGGPLHLYQGNVLTMIRDEYQADKVFLNFPFGAQSVETCPPDMKFSNLLNGISRTDRAEWSFVLSALSQQKVGGKTVVVVTLGMLFRMTNGAMKIRKAFVSSGRLEAVVVLPGGLLPYTQIPIALMVFSQNNDSVRFIDASQFGERNHRCLDLSEAELQKIRMAMQQDSEYSGSVKLDKFKEMNYSLLPQAYLNPLSITIEKGVPLKELSLSIKRGANIMARKLDEMSCEEPTHYQYLMLKDIRDGRVSRDLPYLAYLDKKLEHSIVHAGDLLISRNAPFKIAVMPDVGAQQVIANGNLYFLHLDAEKIHPIYAMLYLCSHKGMQQLNSVAKGMTLQGVSLKDLEKIEIPMIPMNEQMGIVKKYRALQEELEAAERQIESIRERMAGLIGGEN